MWPDLQLEQLLYSKRLVCERLPPSSPRLEDHGEEVHSLPGRSPGLWAAGMGQPGAASPMPISRSHTEEGRAGLGRSGHQPSVLPSEVSALPPQILSRGRSQLLPGSQSPSCFHLAGSLSVQGAWYVQVGCCASSSTHCTDPGGQPWGLECSWNSKATLEKDCGEWVRSSLPGILCW